MSAMLIEFVYLFIASGLIIIVFSKLFSANRNINEQLSMLTSMSDIYYSMHLIDLKENKVKEFVAAGKVKEIVNHEDNAAEMMKAVMTDSTYEEYLDTVLSFTDLTTLAERMKNKKYISCEFRGSYIGWCAAAFISIETDDSGRPEKVIFVTRSIDEERTKEEKLVQQSNTDGMTGLFNRRAYEDDMMNYPAVPPELDFVYASIDINGLKTVNDTLGHSAGDELIMGAAEILKRTVGNYGRVYRIGGDEFAAMFFADESHLDDVINEMHSMADEWRGEQADTLAFSVGFVTKREFMTETVREMAETADKRMYADKESYYKRKGVDRRGQAAAHKALCNLYTKILKIDLTEDSHAIVDMDMSEQAEEMGFASKISEWLHEFGKSGQVHEDDLDEYLKKTDIEYLRSFFRQNNRSLTIYYRRKYGDSFRQAVMEMIPADDYTDEHQTLFLYVKNMN